MIYLSIGSLPYEAGGSHVIMQSLWSAGKRVAVKLRGADGGTYGIKHGHLTLTSLFPIGSYCISVCSFCFLPL